MIPTTITCAHCGGHDFRLVIQLDERTALKCVNHDDHVAQMDMPEQRRQIMVQAGIDPDEYDTGVPYLRKRNES